MIHRCRPDFQTSALWHEMRLPMPDAASLGGFLPSSRPMFDVPSAREGLRWFLSRAGIGQGDEVAMPALCCEVVADSIIACGATPVIHGIAENFGSSAGCCFEALSPKTRAIIVPHLYGFPADLTEIKSLCQVRGLLLIEDCAPCILGETGGTQVGEVGDAAIYSFKFDKPLALGWGGGVTLSPDMLDRVGAPRYPSMSSEQDLVLVASLAVQQFLSDPIEYQSFLGMDYALARLLGDRELLTKTATALDGMLTDGGSALRALWQGSPQQAGALRFGRAASRWLARAVRLAYRHVRGRERGSGRASAPFPLAGLALARDGMAFRALRYQAKEMRTLSGAHRRHVVEAYLDALDHTKFMLPSVPKGEFYPLRLPVSYRGGETLRDRAVQHVSEHLGIEIAPSNWPMAVHQVARLCSHVRVAEGAPESQAIVAGLLNLPVHAQVSLDDAKRLASTLNAIN